MRLKSAGKGNRHPLWSKEQFLDDLRTYGVIRRVCDMYAAKTEDAGWRAYYTDQWQWRKQDPEFDATVKGILEEGPHARPNAGRKRKDGGDKSWQDEFCDALIKFNWSFEKAAEVTPYTVRQLMEFQDPACSSYDDDFTKKVEAAELVIGSKAREILVGAGLDEASYVDFETAKITQTKLWAALKIQERLEKKYGRRHLEISGQVQHQHQHRLMPREERLALLWEDREKFLSSGHQNQIESGQREAVEILDVEAIEVEAE